MRGRSADRGGVELDEATFSMSIMWHDRVSGAWKDYPITSIDGNETQVWVRTAITHFSKYELFIPMIAQE